MGQIGSRVFNLFW